MRRLSQKYRHFLESDDTFPVTEKFVKASVIPKIINEVRNFGDGWIEDGLFQIHTREIQALLDLIEGRCE